MDKPVKNILNLPVVGTDEVLVYRKTERSGKRLSRTPVSSLPSTPSTPAPGGSASTFTLVGSTSVSTSATPTAGAVVAPEPAACTGMRFKNGGVPIEYQRKVGGVFSGAFYPFKESEDAFIVGITDASDIGFRRVDYATARPSTTGPTLANQVSTLSIELINTSDTISATNLSVTTISNSTYTAFPSFACVAMDLKNVSSKDASYKIDGGQAIFLRKNSSKLITGITNSAQVSVVSTDSVGTPKVVAQAFQAIPPSYVLADLKRAEIISNTAAIEYGMASGYQSGIQKAKLYPTMMAPFTRFKKVRKVISSWDLAANTIASGGTVSDVALTGDQVFPTNGDNTAVNNSITSVGTVTHATTNNAVTPVDCTSGIIELLSYRVGSTGVISSHKLRLYSEGTPASPGANYHEVDITGDLLQGFSSSSSIYARSYSTNLFSPVGNGANMGAILFGTEQITTSAGGAQIRPCEIAHVKKASKVGTLVISCDDNGIAPLANGRLDVAGMRVPFTFFPSPNAKNTGAFDTIPVDAMLKLQNSDMCSVSSQDFLNERNIDMTAEQWEGESQNNIGFLVSLGFSGENARDFSLYGGGPYYISGEQRKVMDRLYASCRRFDSPLNADSTTDSTPLTYFVDTNPPGNPYDLRAFNISGFNGFPPAAEVVAKFLEYIDKIIATQGLGGIAMHNDLSSTYYRTIFQGIMAGVRTRVAAGTLQLSTIAEQRRLSTLVTDVDPEVAIPLGATNTSRYFRARWRTSPSVLASPTRVALLNKTRRKIVIGNYSPTNTLQFATTNVANSNRNPPTSGWVDIPPLMEWVESFNGRQFWVRPKVDGAACLTKIETEDYL